jgi:hypothetical protein
MGAFCQATGEDADELPYTTSRTLDVKQPEPAAAAAVPFWRRLGSPKGSSAPLPPAAQVSRPYLGSRVSHGRSSSISVGRITATASALTFQRPGAVSSKDTDSVIQEVRYGADVGPQSDMSVVGRSMSFSARATKQWATLRKTFTRSQQSFQATQSTQRDWESVRLFQVLPPALAARAHVWHNKMNVKDGWICWDNIYFEAPGVFIHAGALAVASQCVSLLHPQHGVDVQQPLHAVFWEPRCFGSHVSACNAHSCKALVV